MDGAIAPSSSEESVTNIPLIEWASSVLIVIGLTPRCSDSCSIVTHETEDSSGSCVILSTCCWLIVSPVVGQRARIAAKMANIVNGHNQHQGKVGGAMAPSTFVKPVTTIC